MLDRKVYCERGGNIHLKKKEEGTGKGETVSMYVYPRADIQSTPKIKLFDKVTH